MNTRWIKVVVYVTLISMVVTTLIMSVGLLLQ